MQPTSDHGSPECVKSPLCAAVSVFLQDQERLAEEDLLGLAIGDTVLAVLASIAGVPFETLDAVEVPFDDAAAFRNINAPVDCGVAGADRPT